MTTTLQHEEYQGMSSKPSNPLRRERLRTPGACQTCRRRKAKCDGSRPGCSRSQVRRANTSRSDSATIGQQNKRNPPLGYSHVPIPVSPPTSTAGPSLRDEDHDVDPDRNRAYCTAHGRFAGDVAAAIDVRAGLAPAASSNLIPFVDAPLFGEIDLDSPYGILDFATELPPPRAHADRLVNIYFQHVEPVEPILDRERFYRDYEASYSRPGALLHADRDVWFSILNVVFALAVQRQESTPLQRRNEEGNRYFQRAWALLRPETILWKPGSLELVQCLMLMNRYLHCTNNQHKTWMTAGLAIRIAQSMGCHLPETFSAKESIDDRRLKQKVWASCIALDRCVSWSLGRTSAPSLIPIPNKPDSTSSAGSYQQDGRNTDLLTRVLELYEIGNQIQLAQTQTRNGLASRLGLPRLYQQEEYHAVAIQLDACLNKWENSLPSDWKLENLREIADRGSRAERYLLHIRLLHTRIFLYRPMLARFYCLKSHTAPSTSLPNPSLTDRLLKEWATTCVATAQSLTALIVDTLEPHEPFGVLPWWYRIYYLHIAGANFLAAMFVPDLFTEGVARSWDSVLAALRGHEILSAYVPQCVGTFETLAARILESRYPGPERRRSAMVDEGEPAGLAFAADDIFGGMGFDFDSYLFGMEDIMDG